MASGTILHADLDAFYASVEQLHDPSLRSHPIAVGGGVVLAASYEAKAFGVRGGMAGRRARELCPQLRFVGGNFNEYQRLGDAAIKILGDYTPLVERLSIDEAFAEVAGCERLFGPPEKIAKEVRRRVREELGLSISVGVARTKHLAKIASQVAKPDGLVVVDTENELAFLHDLPLARRLDARAPRLSPQQMQPFLRRHMPLRIPGKGHLSARGGKRPVNRGVGREFV
jgi:DNA polymerase-4